MSRSSGGCPTDVMTLQQRAGRHGVQHRAAGGGDLGRGGRRPTLAPAQELEPDAHQEQHDDEAHDDEGGLGARAGGRAGLRARPRGAGGECRCRWCCPCPLLRASTAVAARSPGAIGGYRGGRRGSAWCGAPRGGPARRVGDPRRWWRGQCTRARSPRPGRERLRSVEPTTSGRPRAPGPTPQSETTSTKRVDAGFTGGLWCPRHRGPEGPRGGGATDVFAGGAVFGG